MFPVKSQFGRAGASLMIQSWRPFGSPIRHASYRVEVYLLQDVERVGKQGQIVEVKPGYARNFLIPKNKAILMGEGEYQKKLPILHEQRLTEQQVITARQIDKEVRKWLEYTPMNAQEWLLNRRSVTPSASTSTPAAQPESASN